MPQAKTKVVMLPGLDGTGLLFGPALRACPNEFEAVVEALPALEPLDYQALAERVTPALPVHEPFILLGESFSGPLALEVAARRPVGLLGVVLVATFVTPPKPGWVSLLPWKLIFRFSPPQFLVQHFFLGRCRTEELQGILQRLPELVAPEVMASRVEAVSSVDARGVLSSCPVPILYLQASQDRLVPDRALAEVLRVRPEVEHRRIDSPHFVFQVAPDEAWGHILTFLRDLKGAF